MTITARNSARRRDRAGERSRHVVRALFDAADGRVWSAIGGGGDLASALADARNGLPAGRWQLAGYEYVYGD